MYKADRYFGQPPALYSTIQTMSMAMVHANSVTITSSGSPDEPLGMARDETAGDGLGGCVLLAAFISVSSKFYEWAANAMPFPFLLSCTPWSYWDPCGQHFSWELLVPRRLRSCGMCEILKFMLDHDLTPGEGGDECHPLVPTCNVRQDSCGRREQQKALHLCLPWLALDLPVITKFQKPKAVKGCFNSNSPELCRNMPCASGSLRFAFTHRNDSYVITKFSFIAFPR